MSLKRRLLENGKIVPKRLMTLLEEFDERITALEAGSSSEDGDKVTYNFVSYGDKEGTIEWGTGTAETTGVTKGNYTQIEVKTNSVDGFVGNKYFIISSAKTNGTSIYKLYTDAGSTSAGVWVKISTE